MLHSMTGYGKGEIQAGGRKCVVEIKSVNNKYSEFNIRMPRLFNPLEERLRKQLSSQIFRGRVDVSINFSADVARDGNITYDEALAAKYHDILTKISSSFDLKPDDSKILELVARFPDVVEIDREIEEAALEELWAELSQTCELAVNHFIDMRRREGAALSADIFGKAKNIEGLLTLIEKNAPKVIENYREKLKKRIVETLDGIAFDEARFLNEIAFFADKSSIDEEITRLKSHIAQLYQILATGGLVGRKLDFLAQELAREANTIGSKANNTDISKIVIELKSEIEKIREQVQNIE